MFQVRGAAALTRSGADIHFRRLLSSRRLRSTSASPATTRTERRDDAGIRGGAWGAAGRTESHGHPGTTNEISVDFEQTQEAYKSKDSLELLRSLVVFKLCSYDFLVDRNKEIMDLGKKVLGQKVFDQFMKMTFYGQFVAGEDHRSIKPLIQKNQAFGVGSVLDYSVEEDISEEKETEYESSCAIMHWCVSHREGKHKVHKQSGDRGGGATEARTYFHSDEAKCDRHMETFIKCIKASGGASADGFAAIKLTALGRPQFLLQFSEVLLKWQRFFTFLSAQQGKDGMEALDQRLELAQLQVLLAPFLLFILLGFHYGDMSSKHHLRLSLGELEPLLKQFTVEEEDQMKRVLQRVDVLAKLAQENGVRLMVDAEQTYFQPAISRLTLEMQRVYNRETPVIFNTYQCYLKEAYSSVTMDVELSRREGWHFAAKLVRGAYMYQERDRAKEFGYEDPINPNYETTNWMYHRCLDYVLDEIALNRKANVMVASHNEDTVKHTLMRMKELGLSPTENKVFFGQLLGMCDQISFPLGQAGFPVYKYVPYGPVNEVMPYLSRRAQENRGFMKGVQKERELLWKELKRRLASGDLLYRPAY
uniref:Proline dehydrogenase n=1 Tax=Salarias fasciatus TaxID=181472 RepID=A0A672IIP5_SALFA